MKITCIPVFSILVLLISACDRYSIPGKYNIDTDQGNIVTQTMLNSLKVGMNKIQVNYIMGKPLIIDKSNSNRWEYILIIRNNNKKFMQRSLILFFNEKDILVTF